MTGSTARHAVEQLRTFGIDVDPDQCDPWALRMDAAEIREGILPLHMDHLSACPPRFTADLLDTLADTMQPGGAP